MGNSFDVIYVSVTRVDPNVVRESVNPHVFALAHVCSMFVAARGRRNELCVYADERRKPCWRNANRNVKHGTPLLSRTSRWQLKRTSVLRFTPPCLNTPHIDTVAPLGAERRSVRLGNVGHHGSTATGR